jgi:NADPH-dependent curcumin reductase CurA
MKEIGADVAFNYKTTNTNEVLAKEGPINLYVHHYSAQMSSFTCHYSYWDNVGGEALESALTAAADHASFIVRSFFPFSTRRFRRLIPF